MKAEASVLVENTLAGLPEDDRYEFPSELEREQVLEELTVAMEGVYNLLAAKQQPTSVCDPVGWESNGQGPVGESFLQFWRARPEGIPVEQEGKATGKNLTILKFWSEQKDVMPDGSETEIPNNSFTYYLELWDPKDNDEENIQQIAFVAAKHDPETGEVSCDDCSDALYMSATTLETIERAKQISHVLDLMKAEISAEAL